MQVSPANCPEGSIQLAFIGAQPLGHLVHSLKATQKPQAHFHVKPRLYNAAFTTETLQLKIFENHLLQGILVTFCQQTHLKKVCIEGLFGHFPLQGPHTMAKAKGQHFKNRWPQFTYKCRPTLEKESFSDTHRKRVSLRALPHCPTITYEWHHQEGGPGYLRKHAGIRKESLNYHEVFKVYIKILS